MKKFLYLAVVVCILLLAANQAHAGVSMNALSINGVRLNALSTKGINKCFDVRQLALKPLVTTGK